MLTAGIEPAVPASERPIPLGQVHLPFTLVFPKVYPRGPRILTSLLTYSFGMIGDQN
jgi:hypothetical protein